MGLSGGKDKEKDEEYGERQVAWDTPDGIRICFWAGRWGRLRWSVGGDQRPSVSSVTRTHSPQGYGALFFPDLGRGVLLPSAFDDEERTVQELNVLLREAGLPPMATQRIWCRRITPITPVAGSPVAVIKDIPSPKMSRKESQQDARGTGSAPRSQRVTPTTEPAGDCSPVGTGAQASGFYSFASSAAGNSPSPTADLAEYLTANGCERYALLFVRNEFDLRTFAELTPEDLDSLGVRALGARKQLLSLARGLQEPPLETLTPQTESGPPPAALSPRARADYRDSGYFPELPSNLSISTSLPPDSARLGAAEDARRPAGAGVHPYIPPLRLRAGGPGGYMPWRPGTARTGLRSGRPAAGGKQCGTPGTPEGGPAAAPSGSFGQTESEFVVDSLSTRPSGTG